MQSAPTPELANYLSNVTSPLSIDVFALYMFIKKIWTYMASNNTNTSTWSATYDIPTYFRSEI